MSERIEGEFHYATQTAPGSWEVVRLPGHVIGFEPSAQSAQVSVKQLDEGARHFIAEGRRLEREEWRQALDAANDHFEPDSSILTFIDGHATGEGWTDTPQSESGPVPDMAYVGKPAVAWRADPNPDPAADIQRLADELAATPGTSTAPLPNQPDTPDHGEDDKFESCEGVAQEPSTDPADEGASESPPESNRGTGPQRLSRDVGAPAALAADHGEHGKKPEGPYKVSEPIERHFKKPDEPDLFRVEGPYVPRPWSGVTYLIDGAKTICEDLNAVFAAGQQHELAHLASLEGEGPSQFLPSATAPPDKFIPTSSSPVPNVDGSVSVEFVSGTDEWPPATSAIAGLALMRAFRAVYYYHEDGPHVGAVTHFVPELIRELEARGYMVVPLDHGKQSDTEPSWRPIESAPKDGRRIFLYAPDDPAIYIEASYDDQYGWITGDDDVVYGEPEHWTNLPDSSKEVAS